MAGSGRVYLGSWEVRAELELVAGRLQDKQARPAAEEAAGVGSSGSG